MSGSRLRFSAEYDFSPEIVWDAFVDPDLASGWLAEADIDARIDGRYDLEWLHFAPVRVTTGQIVELIEPHLLVVETDNFGVTTIQLDRGVRGEGTVLTVTVDALADPQFTSMIAATWAISLEQLEELLRGHPVNWGRWREERAGRWHELLEGERRV